jgi:hypothetical protein
MKKPTTERAGRLLAVKMLEEMERYSVEDQTDDNEGGWPWSIYAKYRPRHTEQDNVLLRYLDELRGSRAALVGFCAVITDHLGNDAVGGGAIYADCYKDLTARDMTGKPGPWPSLDDEDNERKAAFDAFMSKVLPSGDAAH